MRQTRIFGEDGYTLIELTVAVAILATLTIWGMESFLARRPAELGAAVREFASKLGEARALALANAGGFEAADGTDAAASTGATLWVRPDPGGAGYSLATLYWYRPIAQNPCNGCVQRDTTAEPLRTAATLSAIVPGYGSSESFAVFISPSGHLSAVTDGTWVPGRPWLASEPACDQANPPSVLFTFQGNRIVRHLSCSDAGLVP